MLRGSGKQSFGEDTQHRATSSQLIWMIEAHTETTSVAMDFDGLRK